MDMLLVKYAELVIRRQLQLRVGEQLSINTESSTIEFARLLARMAAEATVEPVQIVETRQGRVLQVYPIEPDVSDALRPKPNGVVLCHIVDLDKTPYESEESPKDLAKDVVQLGHFGLLADPLELERRLSAPWANVPYPGPNWGLQYLGDEATEGDMWKLFMRLFRLDAKEPSQWWSNQSAMLDLRRKQLDSRLDDTLLLSGEDWNLTLKIARDTSWAGGETRLPSGRSFISQLPLQHLFASVDASSAEGSFASSRPFLLLGRRVEQARFTIEHGKAVRWTATQGKEALDAFFSVDEGAATICELSLADNDTRESGALATAAHPLFNKATSSFIGFGGFSMDTLARQFTEAEVDDHHLGRSLVRMDVPIGSDSLHIEARDAEGESIVLMEEGNFVTR